MRAEGVLSAEVHESMRNLVPSVAEMHRFTFARLRDIPRLEGPTFAFVAVMGCADLAPVDGE